MKAVAFGTIFVAWSAAVLWTALRRPQTARLLLGALFCSVVGGALLLARRYEVVVLCGMIAFLVAIVPLGPEVLRRTAPGAIRGGR
jgi:uncharacterized membrane protein YhhN